MAEFVETTLMDGYADGPHITEVQVGLANQADLGPDDYVLEGGRESEAEVLTNNSIRIFDAVYSIQGRRDVIAANDYKDVVIENGAQGVKRNDIICRRYKKDEVTEVESTEYVVIKGTPTAGEPVDPEVTVGDLRNGDLQHDMKLYRVRLDGLNIIAVEPLFKVLYNKATMQEMIDQLNKNYILDSGENENGYWRKWSDGALEMWGNQKIVSNIANNNTVPYYNPPRFITLPIESTTPVTVSLNVATGGMIWSALAAETSKEQIAYRLFSGVPYSNVSVEVHWTAKGRWK